MSKRPVSERVVCERLHILGEDVVPAAQQCQRTRGLHEADRSARARTERDVLLQLVSGRTRGRCEVDCVADERWIDVDTEDGSLQRLQILQRQRLPKLGRLDELAVHDRQLLVVRRIVDQDLEHEAVDLRLGQRIGALRLDRVLRRHDEEGIGHGIARVADRHLALLHHLEQRRLHLRGRAVDLVGEQEVAEDRPELGVEHAFAGPVDACPDEVRRHEVRRELDAGEGASKDAGGRLDRQRLGQARHALDQQVALREETDEDPLEHGVLPGDHPPDLEKRLLEAFLGLGGRGAGHVVHVISLGC